MSIDGCAIIICSNGSSAGCNGGPPVAPKAAATLSITADAQIAAPRAFLKSSGGPPGLP